MSEPTDDIVLDIYDPGVFSVSEIFHENTKMIRTPLWNSLFRSSRLPDDILIKMLTSSFKSYSNSPSISLPAALCKMSTLLETVLLNRRSIRAYSGAAISIEQLAKILSLGCGISGKQNINESKDLYLRAYPSGGALYPLEIYLTIFNVPGINKGLYHYNVKNNSLENLISSDLKKELMKSIMYPEIVSESSVILLISAMFPRTMTKYGERGYRFVLLEAGHLAQNVYLIATALGLGCVSIGGFIDDELNSLIGLDGVNEAVIYTIILGDPRFEPMVDVSYKNV